MPAISVRDLQVKDDASCLCSDLVAGTHGRGFWILDDVTPLRQAAEIRAAASAGTAYLVKPATGVRVRFGTNDPTPWPPELPAGENPPPGAILDYYLPANASGRSSSRSWTRRAKSCAPTRATIRCAARSGDRSGGVQQALPADADGARLRPAALLARAAAGALDARRHASLQLGPALRAARREGGGRGGGGGAGAVPHRTYPAVNAPWAPPGTYTVRLTVDGKSYTQPLDAATRSAREDAGGRADAAVDADARAVRRRQAAHAAAVEARALSAQVDKRVGHRRRRSRRSSTARAAGGHGGRGAAVAAVAADAVAGGAARRSADARRQRARDAGAAMAMQSADVAPTAAQVSAANQAHATATATLARWARLRGTGLTALNSKLKAAGQPTITP